MLIGFAITQHCNLRCPHCIRDDVTTVQSLPLSLIESVLRQAEPLFDSIGVSLTGGEPLLHPEFSGMVDLFARRGVTWRVVTNGWHMRRAMPILDRYPPQHVRLSLSGAGAASHDAVRGRGSFERVLIAVALLTSRRIHTSFSLVIDRTSRGEIRQAVELADGLGVPAISFILPQPSAGSLAVDSEVDPAEWSSIREEIEALAADTRWRTRVGMDYGAPFAGAERPCATFALDRIYIDAWGRLATCCQLSDYGHTQSEVVADVGAVPFAQAFALYRSRLDQLRAASAPGGAGGIDPFPCMRCARASGKLEWLDRFPESAWARRAAPGPRRRLPVLR